MEFSSLKLQLSAISRQLFVRTALIVAGVGSVAAGEGPVAYACGSVLPARYRSGGRSLYGKILIGTKGPGYACIVLNLFILFNLYLHFRRLCCYSLIRG